MEYKRELQAIDDPARLELLLQKYLSKKSLFIRGFEASAEAKIIQSGPGKEIVMFLDGVDPGIGEAVSFFRTIGRYVQLDCRVMQKEGENYRLYIEKASIATRERKYIRLPVEEGTYITNIRTSKYTIDATVSSIPTAVKINFSTNEQRLKQKEDYATIDIFEGKPDLYRALQKSGKILYVRDTTEVNDFSPPSEDFFNYQAYLGEKLIRKMDEYRAAGIRSDIIYPIKYRNEMEEVVIIGYIQIQSKHKNYERSRIKALEELVGEILHQIQMANTILVQKRQHVLNLSRGGLRLLITDAELQEYLIRQGGFSFDLIFKMQAPITLYGLIRSSLKTKRGELIIGVQISGNSSRPQEMKRFVDNIAMIEKKLVHQLSLRRKQENPQGG